MLKGSTLNLLNFRSDKLWNRKGEALGSIADDAEHWPKPSENKQCVMRTLKLIIPFH